MTGRRHSYHNAEGVQGTSKAEEIAKEYITSAQRRLSQPISPPVGIEISDLNVASPMTPKKKKKKPKERRKHSKQRGKGNSNAEGSDGAEGNTSEFASPLVSPSSKGSPKKKKRTKKLGQNDEALGVVIIPDCDRSERRYEDDKDVQNDESARFSAVTEPTQLLDEDDFTAVTKDTKDVSTKDEKKKLPKPPKSPKSMRKKKATKERTRTKTPDKARAVTPDKTRTKTPTKTRRSTLTKTLSLKGPIDDKKNGSWGADSKGDKTFIAPGLLNLLVDPEVQLDGSNRGTMPLKKSSSFHRADSGTMPLKKSNSFHKDDRVTMPLRKSNSFHSGGLDSQTKQRERPLRSKKIHDPIISTTKNETWGAPDTKNESWGASGSPTKGKRSSYSPELLNLYTSPFRTEKPSPQLRRNVKSFNSAESWMRDPKRDHDIPSILFISQDGSEPSFNESWDSRQFDKPSSHSRRKETINGNGMDEKPPSMRARSAGANSRRRRSSTTSQKNEKPPQPLRKKEFTRRGSENETWDADPRSLSNKVPLSPRLVDMLGMSPSTRKKSPGRLKRSISKSPSFLKNNLMKLRGGGTKENTLKSIPML